MVAKKKAAKKRPSRKKIILPMKMSSLINIALKDLRAVEKQEKFIINMSSWMDPEDIVCLMESTGREISREAKCAVCFAGSVMAKSLNGNTKLSLMPQDFPKNQRQLEAIDDLRTGQITRAARTLDFENWKELGEFDSYIPEYNSKDPKPFHVAMKKLAEKLRKHKL